MAIQSKNKKTLAVVFCLAKPLLIRELVAASASGIH